MDGNFYFWQNIGINKISRLTSTRHPNSKRLRANKAHHYNKGEVSEQLIMPRKKKDLHRSNTNTNANLTKHVSIEFSTNQPRSGYGEDNIKKSRRQSTGQFTTLDTKAIRALSAKSPETKTTNMYVSFERQFCKTTIAHLY